MATTVKPRLLDDGVTVNTAVKAAKAAPYTPTMPAPFVLGNVALVWVSWLGASPSVVVSGGGATWTRITFQGDGSTIGTALYLGVVDGSNTAAFDVATSGTIGVQVIEVAGVPATAYTDGNWDSRFVTGSLQLHTGDGNTAGGYAGAVFTSGCNSLMANATGTINPAGFTLYGSAASTAGGKAASNFEVVHVGYADLTQFAAGASVTGAHNLAAAASAAGIQVWLNDATPPVNLASDDAGTSVQNTTVAAWPGQSRRGVSDSFDRSVSTDVTLYGSTPSAYGVKWSPGNNPSGVIYPWANEYRTIGGRARILDQFFDAATTPPSHAAMIGTSEPAGTAMTLEFAMQGRRATYPATAGVAVQAGLYRAPDNTTADAPSFLGLIFPHPEHATPDIYPMYVLEKDATAVVVRLPALTGGVTAKPLDGHNVRVTYDPATRVMEAWNLTTGEYLGTATIPTTGPTGAPNGWEPPPDLGIAGSPYHPKHVGLCQDTSGKVDNEVVAEFDYLLAYPTGTPPLGTDVVDTGTAASEGAGVVIIGVQVDVELWEAGVKRATLFSGYVDRGGLRTLDLSFDASLLSNKTGADVEVRLIGSGANDTLNIDSVAWDAQYLMLQDRELISSDSGTGVEAQTLDKVVLETDSGTSTESVASITKDDGGQSLTSSDTAVGTEAELVEAQRLEQDSSTSTETTTLVARPVASDSAVGADANQPLTISHVSTDSGFGEENQRVDKALTQSDSGLGTDSHTITKPPKVMLHNAERTLVGRASFDLQ